MDTTLQDTLRTIARDTTATGGLLATFTSSTARTALSLVFLCVLLAVLTLAAVQLYRAWRAAQPGTLTQWVATAPTTNLRLLNGLLLANTWLLGTMLLYALGYRLPLEVLTITGGFVLVQQGLDVTMWGVKRATFNPAALGQTREAVDPPPAQPAAVVGGGAPMQLYAGPPAALPAPDAPGARVPGVGA